MSRHSPSRTKHLGFKPPGENPAHDAAYAVLEALPRGAASDFVAAAIAEYLANHSGETVGGSVYIMPTVGITAAEAPSRKPRRNNTRENAAKTAPEYGEDVKEKTSGPEDDLKTQGASESGIVGEDMPPDKQGGTKGFAQPAPFTGLDDATLTQLVLGFGSSP